MEARVAVWHADDALVVPAGALSREGNARSVALEAAKIDSRFTEVLCGLSEGDDPPVAVTRRR